MRLTSKSQYGFQVLGVLVRNWHEKNNSYMPVTDLAAHCDTSAKYLEHVLLTLSHAGILDSKRGQRGGYRLNQPPDAVSLAEVVRHLEGRLMPIPSWADDSSPDASRLIHVLRRVREVIRDTLEATTISILATDTPKAEEEHPAEALMYSL